MREVLLTVRLACSELADMSLLLHSLVSRLPAELQQQHRSEQQATLQADPSMGAEQLRLVEEGPSRVAPISAGSPKHARSSPSATELLQQKAEKWKARCHDLRRELAALSVESVAKDATLQVDLPEQQKLPLRVYPGMDTPAFSTNTFQTPSTSDRY